MQTMSERETLSFLLPGQPERIQVPFTVTWEILKLTTCLHLAHMTSTPNKLLLTPQNEESAYCYTSLRISYRKQL